MLRHECVEEVQDLVGRDFAKSQSFSIFESYLAKKFYSGVS